MVLGMANGVSVCTVEDEPTVELPSSHHYSCAVAQFICGEDGMGQACLDIAEACAPTLRCPA